MTDIRELFPLITTHEPPGLVFTVEGWEFRAFWFTGDYGLGLRIAGSSLSCVQGSVHDIMLANSGLGLNVGL